MQAHKIPSVKILFFGATADAAGAREEKLELGEASNVSDAVAALLALHPRLTSHKLLIAVNEEYVAPGTSLKDGDEMAVFTAVSGG